jgi:HSP20 family protein
MALPTRVSRAVASYDPFEFARREFDQVLNRIFHGFGGDGDTVAPFAVDVREDADHIYVEADLPGFTKDEVNITMENQTLTITAEKRMEEEKKGDHDKGDYLLQERRYTRFQRSFTLPPTVDENSVQAKLSDGVLKLTLNKREESKPRKITVQ